MTKLLQRTMCIALIGATAMLPVQAMASEQITCESRHGRYQFCRADTDGRVKLERELSRRDCREGRSWGYNDRGVWVDHGCSAEFTVGRDNREDRHDKKVAIAAGLVGLAAIAAIASQANNQNHEEQSQEWQQQLPGQHRHQRWRVGDFTAFDARERAVMTIAVQPDGSVGAYSRGRSMTGNFQDNFMSIGDRRFSVAPDGDGFIATEVADQSYQLHFERKR